MLIPASCQIPVGLKRGDKGPEVTRLQEWLHHHGQRIAIDGDFGPATERALVAFGGEPVVDEADVLLLTSPMRRALSATGSIVDIARAHLAEHPREVGGQNRGPWPRLYIGTSMPAPWCLYAVIRWAEQAGLDTSLLSPSCDFTARNAIKAGRLSTVPRVGDVFLVRGAPNDWTHGGIVAGVHDGAIDTIEGNSNDEGGREGVEVCGRIRGVGRLDFVRMGA